MENRIVVNQKDNFQANFGEIFRGSGVFYYKYDSNFKTTLSFLNYWKLKRDLEVGVVATIRELDGTLIQRQPLKFEDGLVINYSPKIQGKDSFEGSVDLEVFSTQNLAIPFSAFTAIYETPESISQVHSYGRNYSLHEIEEKRTLCKANEGCWTLRDDEKTQSFAVTHNGPFEVENEIATLKVKNFKGETKQTTIKIEKMAPYQTLKFVPSEHFKDLPSFLGGKPGGASLHFNLGGAFPRMLVGHESKSEGNLFQVTHSNFDYSIMDPTFLDNEEKTVMYIPDLGIQGKEIIVYAEKDEGEYRVYGDSFEEEFSWNSIPLIKADKGEVYFNKKDSPTPARIVTGLVIPNKNSHIPSECSLGVINKNQPPKRMWWGVVSPQSKAKTKIIIHDLVDIYGGVDPTENLCLRVYSENKNDYLEVNLPLTELSKMEQGISLEDHFSDLEKFLAGSYGYYTTFSKYPGLTAYSLLENEQGFRSLEHGF